MTTADRIKQELTNSEYADLVAAQDYDAIAAMLNARTEIRRDSVPRDVLQNALMQIPFSGTTLWFALRQISQTPSHPASQLADAVVHVVQESLLKSINLDNPAVRQMIGQLRQAGFLTEEQESAIVALGDIPTSRAQILFGAEYSGEAIAEIMGWIDKTPEPDGGNE